MSDPAKFIVVRLIITVGALGLGGGCAVIPEAHYVVHPGNQAIMSFILLPFTFYFAEEEYVRGDRLATVPIRSTVV